MYIEKDYARCLKCSWISLSDANYCGICGNKLK